MVRVRKDTVGILGLSKSGLGCAKLYQNLGFKVKGFDDNYNLTIPSDYHSYFNEIFLGKQPQYVINEIRNYRFLIVSPGVPFNHPIIQFAGFYKIPIISEIEASYKTLGKNKIIIGITGTNGKSTVSTLVYQLIKSCCEKNVFLGGNIGYPFSEICYQCRNIEDPIIVLELSSFQLKMTNNFRSQISVITNITSDHLDRHESIDDYILSKLKLLYFQFKKDYSIINFLDLNTNKYIDFSKLKSKINYFSNQNTDIEKNNYVYHCFIDKNSIFITNSRKRNILFSLDLDKLNNQIFKNRGIYLDNLIPSLLTFYTFCRNIKRVDFDESKIVDVIDNFVPLEYRLKLVGSFDKIDFYSDSKATNLSATKSSLETVKMQFKKTGINKFGLILLVGGIPKYLNREEFWKELEHIASEFKDDLVGVISFGKYSDMFINPFIKFSLKYMYAFSDLKSSFCKAVDLALIERNNFEKIGILLAPGGASFDEFSCAEERGKFYEKLIEDFVLQNSKI